MAEASQAYLSENSPAMLVLEGIVDRAGLRNVLFALESICYEKASHIEENWQDAKTAKVWTRSARHCANAAFKVTS
jgi:hypothetical protein